MLDSILSFESIICENFGYCEGADSAKSNLSSPYDIPKKFRRAKKSRIVGGYTPKSRPWMALLELSSKKKNPFRLKSSGQCGGAIINKVNQRKQD